MRPVFSNFFKRVFSRKADRPEPVNKPVEQVEYEKRQPVKIPERIKGTSQPPIFPGQIARLNRLRRNIRNRMQKRSRVINRP